MKDGATWKRQENVKTSKRQNVETSKRGNVEKSKPDNCRLIADSFLTE